MALLRKVLAQSLLQRDLVLFQSVFVDGIVHKGTSSLSTHEPGLAQHAQVLRDGRLGDAQLVSQSVDAQEYLIITGALAHRHRLIAQ